ncbi:MAG: imidazolonepropionase [Gemmatimonadales bacterium]
MIADRLLTGISQLVSTAGIGAARGAAMGELEIITDAAIAIVDDQVAWVGPRTEWHGSATTEQHLGNRAVLPGLVDPHTHAVWAGDRLADFEARVSGVPYEAILAGGGGIRSTVRHTAAASAEQLLALAAPRIDALMRSGATTIEVKSGYGFTHEAEIVSLGVIAALATSSPVGIEATLLIHVPPANAAERVDYLAMVTHELIPEAARRGLARSVDIFIEQEAFNLAEAAAVFAAARASALSIKAHVDQFHAIGGLDLAVEQGALSVDHLEASGPAQIAALARGKSVAVILPGVTLHLGLPAAPARAIIEAGAAVAVGTDLNPGSSPLFSTQQAMALAVRLNRLTPAEAVTAGTANAAAALGRGDIGRIRSGTRADLLVLDSADWRDLPYTLGASPIGKLFIGGHEVSL